MTHQNLRLGKCGNCFEPPQVFAVKLRVKFQAKVFDDFSLNIEMSSPNSM